MRNYETKVFNYIDKKTGQHIVKATTTFAGKVVSAFAKCDPGDVFDLKFGTDLALKRLDLKITQKRVKRLKAHTKFCKMILNLVEAKRRNIKKTLERTQIAISDRQVEANQLENEITMMLSTR